nr:putative vacuolar protein sorting-associated protein tda6 [Quercus suber]
MENNLNLTNLDDLNRAEQGRHGRYVYLQSKDNPEERPGWLVGGKNIPSPPRPHSDASPDSDQQVPWPSLDDLQGNDQDSAKQQALDQHDEAQMEDAHSFWPDNRTPSENGRCAGNSGFTCKGSAFGQCCSIHGWCGSGEEYCGNNCDPMAGDCIDPLNPPRGPKVDLKRRDLRGAKHKPSPAGRSSAPAFLVVVDKGDGILDAFWFFFYSFNLGQRVLNIRFGNHVGDWEHTMIRFKHGKPETIFLSEHDFGDAYAWHAIEKYVPNPDGSETMIGTWSNRTSSKVAKRPVVYSAIGSHAMYATPGLHPYILPWGLLHDQTDRGPLWDPALNIKSFTYDVHEKRVRASLRNPLAPTAWFDFAGHWGDKYYPLSDPRQYRFAGQYHYVNGPTGPKFKNLGRKHVCQGHGECHVRHWLGGSRAKRLPDEEGEEEGGLPGGNTTDDPLR